MSNLQGLVKSIRDIMWQDTGLNGDAQRIEQPNSVFQPYATVATNLLFFDKGTTTKEIWYYENKLPEGQKSYSKTKDKSRSCIKYINTAPFIIGTKTNC